MVIINLLLYIYIFFHAQYHPCIFIIISYNVSVWTFGFVFSLLFADLEVICSLICSDLLSCLLVLSLNFNYDSKSKIILTVIFHLNKIMSCIYDLFTSKIKYV